MNEKCFNMDYEKAYKEAIERAKDNYNAADNANMNVNSFKNTLIDIFPELMNNDEERIRKDCISIINAWADACRLDGDCCEVAPTCIAWLEKQANKAKDKRYEYFEELIAADDIYQMSMNEEMIKNAKTKVIDALDKLHLLELLGIDNVEHKFNIGDWLASNSYDGNILHIINIDSKDYEVETPQGNTGVPTITNIDSRFHHWTIQDAKDGDVLVNGSNIFIFHFINDTRLMGYCHVNIDDGRFYDDIDKNECFCLIDAVVNPATKEQRDLLFTKMKKSGYEWNANKKKLKKIDIFEPKFKIGDWITDGEAIFHVIDYIEHVYQLVTQSGTSFHFSDVNIENKYHLWTIADAKDGDVIVDKSDGTIGIFESIGHHPDGGSFNDTSYCFLHCRYDDGYFYTDFENGNTADSYDIIPATKEQRDFLFSRMRDAGFEWYADKKELKQINSYCQEHCKGYQETGKCFFDGGCDAKRKAEQKHVELDEDYGIDGLWHAINILERTLGKVSGYQTDDGILEHKYAIETLKKLYDKK